MRVTLVPDLQKYPHAWPMTWNLVEVWGTRATGRDAGSTLAALDARVGGDGGRVLEVVRKYTCRWPIEEVHLVLKSGCKVEDLRLETWEGLEKAVTVNAAVAARIVSWRDLARESPEAPATEALSPDEAEVLVCHFGKGIEAVGVDDRPGGAVDRPPGRSPQSQEGRDAGGEDIVVRAA